MVRFGLRCIITLAILYRAILVSQGGTDTAALSSRLAEAVPLAQARVRDEIASHVGAYCRSEPAACLSNAARLTSLVTTSDAADPPQARHGAIAAAKR